MIEKNVEFSGRNAEYLDKNIEFSNLLENVMQNPEKGLNKHDLALTRECLTQIIERSEAYGPRTKRIFKEIVAAGENLGDIYLSFLLYAEDQDLKK